MTFCKQCYYCTGQIDAIDFVGYKANEKERYRHGSN